MELDLEISAHLAGQKAKIDQKLAELSNIQPWSDEMVFLIQIPGFGLLTSLILLAAVGDIARFSHPKKLVGYAGLGAGVHSSGQKHQEKAMPRGGTPSPNRDAKSCAGYWCAVILIGKRNTSA